ncbi:unnamed protein product [Leptosia nina]|uniref:CBF1-interacting co-repressor CIR N-terminal domain-containing protein n=1 Tax=Leptosia nina TaxID=320188 RepID=A0AAV1JNT7_9NEOP
MGGGDLNSKKSWHPSTMKNQERVWKAEQVAAEEKKRILELQQERTQERDCHELNELARKNLTDASDSRLDWMYKKPDKNVQQEEYLLGRAIDKKYDEKPNSEQNEIPAVSRRVVGSSMISASNDIQVDLARKIREDPLLLVKERERAARAALLNNPVQRKKLTELLRKEQELKVQKEKKKHKKKDKDLDNILAAKLNALSSDKVDLAKLLESDSSCSEDDSTIEKKTKQKKKKKSKKHKREKLSEKVNKKDEKYSNDEVSNNRSNKQSEDYRQHTGKRKKIEDEESHSKKSKKDLINKSDIYDDQPKYKTYYEREHGKNRAESRRYKEDSKDHSYNTHKQSESDNERKREHKPKVARSEYTEKEKQKKPHKLSDEEKAARLAEMMAAGTKREIERGRRVAEQKAENEANEKESRSRIPSRNEARALPESLSSRIHSNRHYIQRNERHMNENFARR